MNIATQFLNTTLRLVAIGLCLFLTSNVVAQESTDFFRKGQIFLDLSGGVSKPSGESISAWENDDFVKMGSLLMLTSNNQTRMLYGAYLYKEADTPTSQATNGRLAFEYAVIDWLGLGVEMESTKIKVKDAFVNSADMFFMTMLLSRYSTNISFLDLITYQRGTVEFPAINTMGFNVSFHFPGSETFDPYFRLAIGIGSVEGGSASKGGGTLGLRIALGENMYTGLEAYGNSFSLVFPEGSTSVQEAGGRVMIGVSF